MEKTKTKDKIKFIVPRIPDELVYETIDGKPIYYKGYREVIEQNQQIYNIKGSSKLQSLLIDLILMYLYDHIDRKKYKILSNELGLNINKNNNLAADISIFNRELLMQRKMDKKYAEIPPKIIVEIDTKADLSNFDNIMEYYQVKTNKLFKFGVEKVLWILTKNKQIIEAVPNDNWLVKEWDKEIQLFENISFSIDQLLKDDGIYDSVY